MPSGSQENSAALQRGIASIQLNFSEPGKVFFITSDATMPKITVICSAEGSEALSRTNTFDWTVSLLMSPRHVPHALSRTTSHPQLRLRTSSPQLDIPFSRVRGGTLTVGTSTLLAGKLVKATVTAELLGTNPTTQRLRAQGIPELLIKLMTAESTLRQFTNRGPKTGYPLFSADNLGGVGIGQITKPRPSDDEVWSWKANAKAALALYAEKQKTAKAYLEAYPHSKAFDELVRRYNQLRAANAAAGATLRPGVLTPKAADATPLTITLPPHTQEMLENETIRLYNGEPDQLHEYIAGTDQNVLNVTVQPDGKYGLAQWHQVTAEERVNFYKDRKLLPKRYGDPDYVQHVRRMTIP